jgi:hypothetical protein
MHHLFTILAVLCVLGGFAGFFFGGIPTLVLWAFAGLFIVLGWRTRPTRQRRREDRLTGPHTT